MRRRFFGPEGLRHPAATRGEIDPVNSREQGTRRAAEMETRIAINGYGRIGKCVLRALYESGHRQHMRIVAINDLADAETIAHLTRYDTTHGRFQGLVSSTPGGINVNGDTIAILREPEPAKLPWADLGVHLVLECTGRIHDRPGAAAHLRAGAQRVLLSHPATPEVDATIVFGINEETLIPDSSLVSNASCTTNCIVPVLKVLDDAVGIDHGLITTVHSAMNDQPAVDSSHHRDLRRSRSALHSIIPVDTGLAKGIDRILPHLAGRFQAAAMRVPTINVSLMDLSITVGRDTSVAEVNALLRNASRQRLAGILGYTEEPLASIDFNHDPRSCIVDGSQTRTSGARLVKVMCWFDNEWGYANRMLDVTRVWMQKVRDVTPACRNGYRKLWTSTPGGTGNPAPAF